MLWRTQQSKVYLEYVDMIQKEVFSLFEGDKWYQRNKACEKLDKPDVLLGEKYASQIKGGKILEIGVGGAGKLNKYSTFGLDAYGIDPSKQAIDEGKVSYPHLNLSVGTADQLNFVDNFFDVVIFGFCLYLIDRSLLSKVVSEADRVLKDQGFLIITDFDPLYPCKRPYHHLPDKNIHSYKMDYAKLFLAYPHYTLVEKVSYSHGENAFSFDPQERIATSVLFKNIDQGYRDV